MTKTNKNPDTTEMENLLNEDYEETMQGRTEEIKQPQFKIIEDSKDEPNLKEAQEFVGGYVEGITFPNGDYLIINEEGKLIGLPLNEQASKLWKDTFDNDNYVTGRKDFVVGNAILIKKDALKIWAS